MVYLIHFDQPYKGKQHYIGESLYPDMRLEAHRATRYILYDNPSTSEGVRRLGEKQGNGAKFLAYLNLVGVHYDIVRLWDGGRELERQLKNQKNAWRLCPVCNTMAHNRMKQ